MEFRPPSCHVTSGEFPDDNRQSTSAKPTTACRSTTVCLIGPLLPSRAPTPNPSPLHPPFLIANGILERPLTHSKQSTAMPPNREKFGVLRTRKYAAGVKFGSEAKKRLIATFAKLETESTHSQHRTSPFANRNKRRVSAMDLFHESRVTNHQSRITRWLHSCRMHCSGCTIVASKAIRRRYPREFNGCAGKLDKSSTWLSAGAGR